MCFLDRSRTMNRKQERRPGIHFFLVPIYWICTDSVQILPRIRCIAARPRFFGLPNCRTQSSIQQRLRQANEYKAVAMMCKFNGNKNGESTFSNARSLDTANQGEDPGRCARGSPINCPHMNRSDSLYPSDCEAPSARTFWSLKNEEKTFRKKNF